MMKDILDLLLKLGWEVPNWLIITLFIVVVLGILCVLIKKDIIPIAHKVIKVKNDIASIEGIKSKQLEIMQKSIDGDNELKMDIEELREDIESLHDKVDRIVDSLDKRWEKEDQAEMSRAQNRLLEMYKRYGLNNPTESWSRYESEVFFNTLESYTAHGGNSFIVNEVVPKMRLLNIIDE